MVDALRDSPARPTTAGPAAPIAVPARDLRLDFFRGIAMFIILVAHIPGNPWGFYIPARYGFSDAAEIFVFCSGMASALAFGRVFTERSWALGTARVAFRVWQVYWAHVGLFLAIAATMVALDALGPFPEMRSNSHVDSLNLRWFLDLTGDTLLGLMTLTYVPNYFDILPMYLVILALIPLMMALARVRPWLPLAVSGTLWAVTQTGVLDLPAEPWSDRGWFFNPFGWQLVFFTGFGLVRGWIPRPPVRVSLVIAAAAFLVISLPFARWQIYAQVEWIQAWRDIAFPLFTKTEQGVLRFLHFLSLAYLAWVLAGPGGRWLQPGNGLGGALWAPVLTVIVKVGQQSLAVFVFSMWLARVLGVGLDMAPERGGGFGAAANLTGFALIIAVAYGVGWFKSQPWRDRTRRPGAA